MIVKKVHLGDSGQKKLKKGIKTLTEAVASTMGPSGRPVIMESEHHIGGKTVTKDGVSVAKAINVYDATEQLGINIAREASIQTATAAGDGTTTALVILQGLLDGSDEHLEAKHNVTQVVRHIHNLTDDAIEFLNKKSKKVTKKKLDQVATISANNDPEIGKMISDLFSKVKVVTSEVGKNPFTTTEVIDGMKFDRGYASEYFITDNDREVVEMENPLILLTDMTIEKLGGHLESILSPIIRENRSLLIIGNMSDQARATLAANKMKGVIKACNVIPPNFGYRQKEMMRDLEVVLGAKYYSEETGDGLHNITLDGLGIARKVVISRDRTVIYRHEDIEEADVKVRLDELKSKLSTDLTLAERKDTEARIANIEGGVGIIYVGAPSEIETKELYDRVDDAVRAVGASIEEGILPGGGVALAFCAGELFDNHTDANYQCAVNIMERALEAPFKQIMENAGLDPKAIADNIMEVGDFGYGFDVKNEKYGMMEKMGVIDPAMATKSALKNAVSVATTIMSSNVVIVNMRENESI
jgi:chaperonin GroEL